MASLQTLLAVLVVLLISFEVIHGHFGLGWGGPRVIIGRGFYGGGFYRPLPPPPPPPFFFGPPPFPYPYYG